MTRLDYWIFAWIVLLTLIIAASARGQATKQAYLVCEGRCLASVKIGPNSKLTVPMVDGKADYKHAVFSGLIVDINHSLEKVEMR